MTKFALDPETGMAVSAEAHALRKKKHGLYALCGACGTELFDHSVTSLKLMGHFKHRKDSGPCRLKTIPPETDIADYTGDGERLRVEFFQPTWIKLGFAVCQRLVCGDRFIRGNFPFARFVELLHVADYKRLWSHKGLTVELIPFALVANEVFDIQFHWASAKRGSVTFVFEKALLPKDENDRSSPRVDPESIIKLAKRFLNDDWAPGGLLRIDLKNPYDVTAESAYEVAGQDWSTRVPDRNVAEVIRIFRRQPR